MISRLFVCLFLVVGCTRGAVAADLPTDRWEGWSIHDAVPGEFTLGPAAATFVRIAGTTDPYISRAIPYGKKRFRFKARYRTDGTLSPTALIFLPPAVDIRPLVVIRLPAATEWTDFDTVAIGHDARGVALELRIYPGTIDGDRMKEGGLTPWAQHKGRVEFQSISWNPLPEPVTDLSKGPVAFKTSQIVFKKTGGLELKVHVDRPEGVTAPRAAVIWYHGGGFVGGTPDSCLLQTTYLASRGIPCVRPQYRLVSQGGNVDVTLEDVMDAIAWVKAHGREHGIDPNRLIIAGTSAGAVMGSIAAQQTPGCLGFVGVCGYYNAVETGDSVIDQKSDFFRGGVEPAIWRRASAIYQISSTPPPAFLVHGLLDSTLDYRQTTAFAEALRAAGGRVEVELVPELNHVPNLIPESVFVKLEKFLHGL